MEVDAAGNPVEINPITLEPFKIDPTTGKHINIDPATVKPIDFDLFRNAYPVPYKRWSGASLAIFRELSNTVVAGMHIVEETELEPAITQLKCTADGSGNLVFPTPSKETVSCTLTGKNLDKVAKLRLRNAQDAADPATVDGSVTVSGDSSNATVSFPTGKLRELSGTAYLVYAVTGNGVEKKTSQSVHLSGSAPFVSDVSPKSVDLTTQNPQPLTLNGFHLKDIKSVTLTSGGNNATIDVASSTDNQLSVSLDSTNMSKFGTDQVTLTIALVDQNKKPIALESSISTVTFKGVAKKKTPAATPKKPKAAPKGKG